MRNISGPPVEGDDYYPRDRDLARFRRELDHGASILLVAPRRVGKTSFILRVCETCRRDGWHCAYVNVESCEDEVALAELLVDELRRQGLKTEPLLKLGDIFRRVRRSMGGIPGLDADIEGTPVGVLLEGIFRSIDDGTKPVLVAIDELPELLLNLLNTEGGDARAAHLLHWLRSLRQTYRRRLRFVFLGSIGLDSFVDDRNLRKTVNDLTSLGLETLTSAEARDMLERLARGHTLAFGRGACQRIIDRVGWLLPYHLQLVFHALDHDSGKKVTSDEVDRAIDHVLREGLGNFDTWRQRLDQQFGPPDAKAAKDLLTQLCQHPEGRSRRQVHDALMTNRPTLDPGEVAEQLARLLLVLQRDGYLHEQDGTYAFRSFLLREYWHRRHLR